MQMIINLFFYSFLLLLPRQIISDSIGTCYEEYVQDANRHYKVSIFYYFYQNLFTYKILKINLLQNWIEKTSKFRWPIEAISLTKEDEDVSSPDKTVVQNASALPPPIVPDNVSKIRSCDSGIAEEQFYEGPLLRLLFSHVRNMAKHPYELNIAVIAIISKLSFLPHPYLHEILLNPEIPISRGTNTLWSNMQSLSRQLLLEIPKIEGFQKRITDTAKRLLTNPPIIW